MFEHNAFFSIVQCITIYTICVVLCVSLCVCLFATVFEMGCGM